MKKPETVMTTFRLPKSLKDRVSKISNGNLSKWIIQAIVEKLQKEKA